METIWWILIVLLILAVLGGGGYGIYLLISRAAGHASADPVPGTAISGLWQLNSGDGNPTAVCFQNGVGTIGTHTFTVVTSTTTNAVTVTGAGTSDQVTGTISTDGKTITLAGNTTLTKVSGTCWSNNATATLPPTIVKVDCIGALGLLDPYMAPLSTTTPLTLANCAALAAQFGYTYCALQHGANGKGQCYGSNNLAEVGHRKTCPNPIPAEGTIDTAVLYAINGAPTVPVPGWEPTEQNTQNSLSATARGLSTFKQLEGCYNDGQHGRRTMNLINDSLTPDQCAQKARQMGYAFIGLQDPNKDNTAQCFGSHTLAEATSQGSATGATCSSLGAPGVNAVYSLNPPT